MEGGRFDAGTQAHKTNVCIKTFFPLKKSTSKSIGCAFSGGGACAAAGTGGAEEAGTTTCAGVANTSDAAAEVTCAGSAGCSWGDAAVC